MKVMPLSAMFEIMSEGTDVVHKKIKEDSFMSKSVRNIVLEYFEGNTTKANLWWDTKNPLLGDVTPKEMITWNEQKLRKFIDDSIKGNTP